jgi:hypothetical protein
MVTPAPTSTGHRRVGNLVVALLFVAAVASGHPFWLFCAALLVTVAVVGEGLRWNRARVARDRTWRPLRPDAA